jgi:hypothetical protein
VPSTTVQPHLMALASRSIAFLVGTLVLISASAALATDNTPSCTARWGKPGRPLVSNPETARAIFLAVEKDFFPNADAKIYPAVEVADEGTKWAVFRWRPPAATSADEMEVTRGGGQLSIAVSKCTAEISDVHLSR